MTLRRAAIVSPLRTAVGKFGGGLSALTAGQLGATIIKALVERSGIDPERVDDVVFGHGYPSGEAPSIGRWSWLAAGLPKRSEERRVGKEGVGTCRYRGWRFS